MCNEGYLVGWIKSFNPFRRLIQNIQEIFLSNTLKEAQRNDEELKCLQFGIDGIQVQSPKPEQLIF